MSLKQKGRYWGFINRKMRLKGRRSKAVCRVVRKRLVTDAQGTVAGSFFLPAADGVRKRKFGYAFSAGRKTFRLVDSRTNSEDQKEISTMDLKMNSHVQVLVLKESGGLEDGKSRDHVGVLEDLMHRLEDQEFLEDVKKVKKTHQHRIQAIQIHQHQDQIHHVHVQIQMH